LRAAIYFTPPAGAVLTRAAALWLGRDDRVEAFVQRARGIAREGVAAEPERGGAGQDGAGGVK
jgi:hypothetical protein